MVDRKISTVYLVAKVTGLPEKLVKKKYEMAKAGFKKSRIRAYFTTGSCPYIFILAQSYADLYSPDAIL